VRRPSIVESRRVARKRGAAERPIRVESSRSEPSAAESSRVESSRVDRRRCLHVDSGGRTTSHCWTVYGLCLGEPPADAYRLVRRLSLPAQSLKHGTLRVPEHFELAANVTLSSASYHLPPPLLLLLLLLLLPATIVGSPLFPFLCLFHSPILSLSLSLFLSIFPS